MKSLLDEEPPEGIERGAVPPAGVRGAKRRAVGVEKPREVVPEKTVQHGTEARRAHPLEHGVPAPKNLDVFGLPHVERSRKRRDEVEVVRGIERPPARDLPAKRPRAEGSSAGSAGIENLPHGDVRGKVAAKGHLRRESTSRGEKAHESRKQRFVSFDPMQRGVGEDETRRRIRGPLFYVRLDPLDRGVFRAGPGEHVGRTVHSAHDGRGPAPGDKTRRVPRAASEIERESGIFGRHAGEQFDGRTATVIREPGVAVGVPARRESFFFFTHRRNPGRAEAETPR